MSGGPASGIELDDDCVAKFKTLQAEKKIKYVTFKLTKDNKRVVTDKIGEKDESYEDLAGKLRADHTPCYAIVDFDYEEFDKDCSATVPKSKVTMISWIPEDCDVKRKMLMTSTLSSVKKKFEGVQSHLELHDDGELERNEICIHVAPKGMKR